jgi:hypothetical protein
MTSFRSRKGLDSVKHSSGPEITLDSKAEKYTGHLLRGDTDQRSALMMTINYLRDHGLTKEIAAKYRLGFVNPAEPADRLYQGMLAIPYVTRAGIVAMKYRCVEDHDHSDFHHGKYSQPEGQDPWIFNPQAFFDAGDVIGVAEGEIDAIVATEFVGVPTIGIPGVDIWKANRKAWRRTLDDYSTVLIFVDGDSPREVKGPNDTVVVKQPGLDMARSIQADVRGRGRLVRSDPGEDVASMVAKGRLETLRERAGLTPA